MTPAPPSTIYALATAPGRAGVAVIRLSGPAAPAALEALTGKPLPPPRHAVRRVFLDPHSGEPLDDGLALVFPAPASFTGEDVVELHGHGGRAVVEALLKALADLPPSLGLRPAEAGEFTRRAFDNGKMDLTQAEALADLIHAETEAQRRQAQRQRDGALGRLYDGWRGGLITAMAHLEAYIDFPEDEIPEDVTASIQERLAALRGQIAQHLNDGHRGERLRDGVHIAILGPPNAGKSSLVNALTRREAAIVSATAGTTRDVVEVHLDLGGYPAILADTAGLREAVDDTVEREGIRRALHRAEQADLRLIVFDGTTWPQLDAKTLDLVDRRCLVVLNKADLATLPAPLAVKGQPAFAVSVREGTGMGEFLQALEQTVRTLLEADGSPPALTRQRHRQALTEAQEALDRALAMPDLELKAEDLRLAARALGRITGRIDVEDLLDVIFSDFCIGK